MIHMLIISCVGVAGFASGILYIHLATKIYSWISGRKPQNTEQPTKNTS